METNDCTQSITSNRIDWLDIAKCIGMFLVIHNHFNLNYGNDIIKIIIASFHMPLFFVASGYTVKQISGISGLLRYIIKRMIGILFPYYLFAMLFSDFSIKNILCIVYGSHQTLSATGGYIAVGWFLPCLFMTNVIVCAIIYVLHDKNNILIDFFIVFALFTMSYILLKIKPSVGYPMNLDISFMGAGFAYSGHMIKKYAVLEKDQKIYGGVKQ